MPKEQALCRNGLDLYQLDAFRKNIAFVKKRSSFYKKLLSDISPEEIKTFDDIKNVPFTFPQDIKEQGTRMVCVTQNEIARIVTLDTSGTTDIPKRIYFTKEDQELTVDFFQVGMSTFTKKNDRVLILLPGRTPGSVGDLLKTGLNRLGAVGIIYGIVDDPEKVESIIFEEDINVIVGIPQQVLAVSSMARSKKIREKGRLRSVLLSTDYVATAVVKNIRDKWGCSVYEHYGMTEMGLGGGVFCSAQKGYHMREADMLFEIVDQNTGKPLEDGEYGEVVFTTLTRTGMPIIRYRTGDIGRFIKEPCSCGTILKTMEKIQHRISSEVHLQEGKMLTMPQLEELLFSIEGIIDFDAVVNIEDNVDCLKIFLNQMLEVESIREKIMKAFECSNLASLITGGKLKIKIEDQNRKELDIKAVKKRNIVDCRTRM